MQKNTSELKGDFLYLSVLASPSVLEEARIKNPSFSNYAVHKFNRLVVEGLCAYGVNVTSLSTFFIRSKFLWRHRREEVHGVKYNYIPSINFGPIRHIWMLVYCFFYVLVWGMTKRRNKVILCDILNISSCMGAVVAARLLRLRRVGIMTDMPGLMVSRSNKSNAQEFFRKESIVARINKSFLSGFTHYVFLTEHMNSVVNKKNRPYIVMEGLVDSEFTIVTPKEKLPQKVVLYAGGLMERYGLKMLVDGFIKANVEDSELWIYGSGPFVRQLEQYNKDYPSVIYKGVKPNEEVIEAELIATLLVNPRPTHEEFTKYSFPSKNMEYMVSGTPLLTTALPGMPTEYYPYVFLFDEGETTMGYAQVIKRILSLSKTVLEKKGKDAREWVLQEKNNKSQTSRIIKLVQS